MSDLIHVDQDEEVTDLVERIRKSGEEKDLVFVVPPRARALSSALSLRLLQQYTRSYAKRAAIVSGDPRLQLLAREAGLAVYASVPAFERGIEVTNPAPVAAADPAWGVEPVPSGGAATPAAGRAATAGAAVAEVAPAAAPAAAPPPPTPPRSAAPAPGSPAARRRRRNYLIAGAVFLAGLLLLFLVAPSATVTVVLRADAVNLSRLIQGTPDATAAAGPDHVLTQVVTADESEQFQAKATGTKQVPPAAATTAVVLATDLPSGACLNGIQKGQTFFQTGSSPTVVFPVSNDITSNSQNPSCHGLWVPPPHEGGGQYGSPSDPVPVTAQATGASGNVAPNTITVWPQNPCNSSPLCAPQDIRVTNPQAASGGTDPQTLTIVSPQDLQGFQSNVDQIKQRLTDRVTADLQQKAPGKTIAKDPNGGGLTLSADVQPPLPAAGDQYATATVTVTMHGKAAMYSRDDVKKVINDDVLAQIPQNEQLASNPGPDVPPPTVTQAGDDGTVVFNATEHAFVQPVVDIQALKDRFAGHSRQTVRDQVASQLGSKVESVDISQSIPFFVLPFFSSRIEVRIEVVASRATT